MQNSTLAWIIVVAVVVLGGGAFWWSSMSTTSTPPQVNTNVTVTPPVTPPTPSANVAPVPVPPITPPAPSGNVINQTTVSVGHTDALGDFLVASNGMTLYLYTKDTPGVTNCYDSCAVNWPPYLVTSGATLTAVSGAKGALTMVSRTDGTKQVAYNGTPLYYWKNDVKPGDTTGQNVGGVWFVVKP